MRIRFLSSLFIISSAGVFTACSDAPTSPPSRAARHQSTEALSPDRVAVCHISDEGPRLKDIESASLDGHLNHGDYVTGLLVDQSFTTTGDGIHFTRITDALATARDGRIARDETTTAGCRITITVAAGIYAGSVTESSDATLERFPLIVDVPDITLRGALVMPVDERGRAAGKSGDATTFAPISPLLIIGGGGSMSGAPEPVISVNSHPDGSQARGAVIEGFVFQFGRAASDLTMGGFGIFVMRSHDVVIRGNAFEGGRSSAVDLRASSATIERNHVSGRGSSCDVCLAGPGNYTAVDNTIIGGGAPGFLILPLALLGVLEPVEQYVLPESAHLTALIQNNHVRNHLAVPVGVGIRIGAIGVPVGFGPSNVPSSSQVSLIGNELTKNTFGIIIEAGFPRLETLRRGDVEVTTSGNVISESCQNDLLVSLANGQTGLGIANAPYLLNSTFTLNLGSDVSWDNAWYAHAAGFGNNLVVNGEPIANGTRRSYSPTRVCTI